MVLRKDYFQKCNRGCDLVLVVEIQLFSGAGAAPLKLWEWTGAKPSGDRDLQQRSPAVATSKLPRSYPYLGRYLLL